ncbi:MAG: 7-carboxy-7-deazaguanine synthase QueE [Candidatus Omnitrophota bacterium]|nr:7-carboxy-7-deazaguanine synthase QueE [Candidatus Omnitrophota bacterium]
MEAKISEIFLSYQGEGPFTGSRQLFVRFYGCNLDCAYCDTDITSYKTFTKEALLNKILDFDEDYNELTLTGGEPLIYADFLAEFLTMFRKHRRSRVYLETNGTLPDDLRKIRELIDVVAMDLKLPSSGKNKDEFWEKHKRFIKIASGKELVMKAVISETTTMDDIKKMGDILEYNAPGTIVLQPVTPIEGSVAEADEEMLLYFKAYLKKRTGKNIGIIGQMHKQLGIR